MRPSLAQTMLAQAPAEAKPAPAPEGARLVDVMLTTTPPASESAPKRKPKPGPTPAQMLDAAKRPAAAPAAMPGPILVDLVREAEPQPRPTAALAPHRLAAVAGAAASLAATSRAQTAAAQEQVARTAPPSGARLVELLPEAPAQPARGPAASAARILDAEAPRVPKPRRRSGAWRMLAVAALLASGLVAAAWMLGGTLPDR